MDFFALMIFSSLSSLLHLPLALVKDLWVSCVIDSIALSIFHIGGVIRHNFMNSTQTLFNNASFSFAFASLFSLFPSPLLLFYEFQNINSRFSLNVSVLYTNLWCNLLCSHSIYNSDSFVHVWITSLYSSFDVECWGWSMYYVTCVWASLWKLRDFSIFAF
jgi:hypothetical protein